MVCMSLLLGAGCKSDINKIKAPPASDIESKYQNATMDEKSPWQAYTVMDLKKEMRLRLPDEWTGEAPKWSPDEESKDYIRVAYFPNLGPAQQWEEQKTSDAHELISATEEGAGRYLLIANYPSLNATKIKLFLSDLESGQSSFFVECRIGYEDPENADIWNACKTAIESAEGYALR